MESQKMIRKVIQILAIIFFIFQFQRSVRKYYEYPVVVQTSKVPIEDLPKPVVYICQADQYNETRSKSLGYNNIETFLSGLLSGTNTTSWHGKDGNLTYNELESILFDYDYTNLHLYSDYGHSKEYILMFPYGICMKIRESNPTILFDTKQKVYILFADPYRANDIWTQQFPESKTAVGPSYEIYYEQGAYKVEHTVHDSSIHEGNTCTDYTKTKNSFQHCINTVAKSEFESWYGCLPPWFPGNEIEKMCQTEMPRKNTFPAILQLLDNHEVKVLKKCLPPCITMSVKLQQTRYERNRVHKAWLTAISQELATKLTEVYSYDQFDFVVDFGSALGLWLGLSCLSILDNILETWMSAKTYWKK